MSRWKPKRSQKVFISKTRGVTLFEILLVLTIASTILAVAIRWGSREMAQERLNRVAFQMQQILAAGFAYYTSYNTWPGGACLYASNSTTNATAWNNLSSLTSTGFLSSTMSNNSYGNSYTITCDSITNSVFYVNTKLSSHAAALSVAGAVPVAYVSDAFGNPSATNVYVTAQITAPRQGLNNARASNFSGIYHHGACVPVPVCPGYNMSTSACQSGTNCMVPQIFVAPVSVNGVSNTGSTAVFPISSFTAYASGPPAAQPLDCETGLATACSLGGGTAPNYSSPLYWRVCLQVIAGNGVVSTTNTGPPVWGQYASMMAVTRCTPPNEPYGSDLTVFTN